MDSTWTIFIRNHAKAPAIALVESSFPEIMDKDFLTHFAQSLLKVFTSAASWNGEDLAMI